MEVRLNTRKKIKHLFKALKIKSNLTLKSIFKPAVSKKVLLHYLDEIESRRPALLDYKGANEKDLLAALIVHNPELQPKQIFQIFGLQQALNIMNLRELKDMFTKSWRAGHGSKSRAWYRLMSDVQKIKLPTTQQPLAIVREQLVKFKPLKLKTT